MLAADGESGAEVYSLATTLDQMRIVFGDAQTTARRSQGLRSRFCVNVDAHNRTCCRSDPSVKRSRQNARSGLHGYSPPGFFYAMARTPWCLTPSPGCSVCTDTNCSPVILSIHHEHGSRPTGDGSLPVALARVGASTVRLPTRAGESVVLGLSAAAGAGARLAREHGALGRARDLAQPRSLGGAGDGARPPLSTCHWSMRSVSCCSLPVMAHSASGRARRATDIWWTAIAAWP